MIRLISLSLMAACLATGSSWAEKFDMGPHGDFDLSVPATWKATGGVAGERGYDVTLQSQKSAEVVCKISLLFFKAEQVVPEVEVQKRFASLLEKSTPQFFKRSGEIQKLKFKKGSGFYASLTEEKPLADKAQVVTSGLAQLPNGYVVSLSVFTNTQQGAELAEAIQIVESLTLLEKAASQ